VIRVLVTDDHAIVRAGLAHLLATAADMECVGEAADGAAALDAIAELRPDVVLLDLSMPRQDGWETLPLLRAEFPGMRVVVLSGLDDGLAGRRAIELGADRYVQKGIDPDALVAIVEELGA